MNCRSSHIKFNSFASDEGNKFGRSNILNQISASYKIFAMSIAIIYGMVLSQLPYEQFFDFSSYLIYAEFSAVRLLSLLNQGLLVALTNEPVWLIANVVLSLFFTPDGVVRVIILFSATTVAALVLLRNPKHFIWLICFLLLAVVVKNNLIHLRQGFAIAIFIMGWFSSSRSLRWFLFFLTPFIHSSFFFIIMILVLSVAMTKLRFGSDIRAVLFFIVSVSIGLSLGVIAAVLGARQAEAYYFTMADASGLGFLIWLTVLILFLMNGRQFLQKHSFECSLLIFYLTNYWLIEVAARIFESGILLVLIAGLALTGWRLFAYKFIVLIVLFGASWLIRIGEPAMGFPGA